MIKRFNTLVPSIATVGLLLFVTLASLWGMVSWKTMQERQVALTRKGDDARNLVHSLAQHASKTFGAVKIALLGAHNCPRGKYAC